jgi:hypothetical protein
MTDTNQAWVPLQARHDPSKRTAHERPSQDVPAWLFLPVWELMEASLMEWGGVADMKLIREMELAVRAAIAEYYSPEQVSAFTSVILNDIRSAFKRDGDLMLDCLDYLLSRDDHRKAGTFGEQVKAVLQAGGSAWTVGPVGGRLGLVRRVPEAAQQALASALDQGGDPASLLATAWGKAFGRSPDPGRAYHEAVRAVEAAAHPVVTPNDDSATLGKIIGTMKSNPRRWAVTLGHSAKVDPPDVVRQMLDLLWTNEYERHATNKNVPLHITQEQAEAAVLLSLTLVSWFQAGHVR